MEHTNEKEFLEKEGFEVNKYSEIRDRMKTYEANSVRKLNPDEPFIIRLDGHKFSTFCKGFKKPIDERIHYAMVHTTADLLKYFSATTAYTESDEISLVFPAMSKIDQSSLDSNEPDKPFSPLFGGKEAKIITLAAGYCSARFNYYLSRFVSPEEEKRLGEKMSGGIAHFDARIFSLPGEDECVNNILWRMWDSRRNSISRLGQHYFKHKELQGWNSAKMISSLANMNVDWFSYPVWFRYGTLIKKKKLIKRAVNPVTGEEVDAIRTVCAHAPATMLGTKPTESSIKLLFGKSVYETTYDIETCNKFESVENIPTGLSS